MIKLTEIYYSDRKDKLRELWVNPSHIALMRDDEELNKRHARKPVIDNLNSAAAFTKLFLNIGRDTDVEISVIGNMTHIKEKMEKRK